MQDKIKLKSLFKNAYRKLKSYAYFDKSQVFLKKRLIEFESSEESVGERLDRISEKFFSRLVFGDYRDLLSSIECKFLPKKVKDNQISTNNIVSNKPLSGNVEIEDYQSFFDAPLEVHLYSMIWTMTIGSLIDKKFDNDIFGNRIRESFQEESEAAGQSPYLMKPYFEQYETWRDKSLDVIQKEHENSKNSIMINLDLKKYYYQVEISEDIENKVYNESSKYLNINKKNLSFKLSEFIFDTMKTYTNKIRIFDSKIESKCLLPLGFMPSMIFSNLFLEEFDECIRNSKPLYYGRYVDDILVVYRSTKSLQIEEDLKNYMTKSCNDSNNDKEEQFTLLTSILNRLYCLHQKTDIQKWEYKKIDKKYVIEFYLNTEKN